MLATVVGERIIHPDSLKTWEGRRSLTPKTIPRISGWGMPKSKKFGRGTEIALLHDGSGSKVTTAAERSVPAVMRRVIWDGRRQTSGIVPVRRRPLIQRIRQLLPNLGKRNVTACFGGGARFHPRT